VTAGTGPTTAAPQTPLGPPGAAAHAVAYSPDGALLATGGDDAAVQLWARGPVRRW